MTGRRDRVSPVGWEPPGTASVEGPGSGVVPPEGREHEAEPQERDDDDVFQQQPEDLRGARNVRASRQGRSSLGAVPARDGNGDSISRTGVGREQSGA